VTLFSTIEFSIYAAFATALCLLLVTVDTFGGIFRARTKTTPNQEDALFDLFKGSKVVVDDPDGVARVMRAHRNALSNIVPFLILMWLYVMLGATTTWVVALCGASLRCASCTRSAISAAFSRGERSRS